MENFNLKICLNNEITTLSTKMLPCKTPFQFQLAHQGLSLISITREPDDQT